MNTYVDQSGNVYYMPEQYVPQQPNWMQILTGIFGLSIVASIVGMAWSKPVYSSSEEELKDLRGKIMRLGFVINKYKEALVGTREHEAKLMKEYHITVIPPLAALRKEHQKLYYTEQYIARDEQELDRIELRMTLYRKRVRELERGMGLRPLQEEEQVTHPRQALKKFVPPPGM
jgi:hypothetical protein